jgi:hypothetical protein
VRGGEERAGMNNPQHRETPVLAVRYAVWGWCKTPPHNNKGGSRHLSSHETCAIEVLVDPPTCKCLHTLVAASIHADNLHAEATAKP